jgi:Flp pilus assembly protein TadD
MGIHFQRGQALFALRRYKEAIAEYQQELGVNPGCAASHSNIASSLINLGRHREAEAEVGQTLQLAPTYAHAFYLLSYLKSHEPINSKAQDAILEAIRLEPSARHFTRLGSLLRQHKKDRESLDAADEALALDARHKDALVLRARALESLGRPDEAADVLRHALSIDPEDPDIHKNLGEVALATGDPSEALDALREARRISPTRHHDRAKILDAYSRRVWPFRYVDRIVKRYRRLSIVGRWAVHAGVATALLAVLLLTGVRTHTPVPVATLTFLAVFNLLLFLVTAMKYPAAVLRVFARRELDVRLGPAVYLGCRTFLGLAILHGLVCLLALGLSDHLGGAFFMLGAWLGAGMFFNLGTMPNRMQGLLLVIVWPLIMLLPFGDRPLYGGVVPGVVVRWCAVLAITGAVAVLRQYYARRDSGPKKAP